MRSVDRAASMIRKWNGSDLEDMMEDSDTSMAQDALRSIPLFAGRDLQTAKISRLGGLTNLVSSASTENPIAFAFRARARRNI